MASNPHRKLPGDHQRMKTTPRLFSNLKPVSMSESGSGSSTSVTLRAFSAPDLCGSEVFDRPGNILSCNLQIRFVNLFAQGLSIYLLLSTMSSIPFNADPDAGPDKNHRSATNTHNRSKIFAIGACLTSAITTIVGGALIGIYFRKAVNNCEDARKRLGDDNFDNVKNEDCVGPSGLFWSAVVCLIIAFISGIGFVFFMLLHCARRGRRNVPPFLYQAAPNYNTGYTQPQPYDPYAAQSCGYPLQPTRGNSQPDVQPPSYFAPQHGTAQTAPEYEHTQCGSSPHPQLEGNRGGGPPQRFY